MLQTPPPPADQFTEEERKTAYLFCATVISQALQPPVNLEPRIMLLVDRISKTMRAAGQVSPIVNTAIDLEAQREADFNKGSRS